MRKPTQSEVQKANLETQLHRNTVRTLIGWVIAELQERGREHDRSKLHAPEVEYFAIYTPMLKELKYGSDEYKRCLEELQPALEHHYATNRHHPEFFPNGIDGMTLVDLIEMLCDWKAATLRTADGSIEESLEYNRERFGISDQLFSILKSTVAAFFEDEEAEELLWGEWR